MAGNIDALREEIAQPEYKGMADDEIATAINQKRVDPVAGSIPAPDLIAAIRPEDLLTLDTNELLALSLVTAGGNGQVNCVPGSTPRVVIETIFAGKATTVAVIAELMKVPLWRNMGFDRELDHGDIKTAKEDPQVAIDAQKAIQAELDPIEASAVELSREVEAAGLLLKANP